MKENKRLLLSVCWVIVGGCLMVLACMGRIDSGLWSGMGGALIAVGIVQIIRNVRFRKDPSYREKVNIEINDERNRYLRLKSWAWAGYLFVLGAAILGIVCFVSGQTFAGQILMGCISLLVALYWVSYMALSRKY